MIRILPQGKLARKEAIWSYFFIAPWIIGFILFTGGPIIASAYLSFTRYNVASAPQWIGIANYVDMFQDRIFYKSIQVSATYTALSVPLGILLSLALAMLLNQKVPFLGVFRTLYYLPSLVTGVSVALLFQWLLNPAFGIVNFVIGWLVGPSGVIPLGISGPGWFYEEAWVVPAHVTLSLWAFGGSMLIYLSALQGVPTALYEAATIDGANVWQKFRNVTLPMISSVILFNFITGIIAAFRVFTQAYVISGTVGGGGQAFGSPNYASMFYVLYLYINAFRRYRFGFAAAQAWVLFIVILVLTLISLRVSRETVYYESASEEDVF
ncbi:MAG: sugar ABC transporter permease [Anaerolineae bacterium]|nr:MAG: sugar ABC transporter permease [Anaerolineae bacterium]